MDNSRLSQATSPAATGRHWWPDDLGRASSDEELPDLRYAFFRDTHRLIVDDAGQRTIFDTGEHDVMRVTRCRYGGVVFTSQLGKFMLACLVRVT